MDIHFHAHHADVSDTMRTRAVRAVVRSAERLPRVVEAIIRFERDGTLRKVSVAFRAPKGHDLLGSAAGRYFGPTLTLALARVRAQAGKEKRGLPKGRARLIGRPVD